MIYFWVCLLISGVEWKSASGQAEGKEDLKRWGPNSVSYVLPHLEVKLFENPVSVKSYGFRIPYNNDSSRNVPRQVALLGSDDCENWQILQRADGVNWREKRRLSNTEPVEKQRWTIAEDARKSFFCYAIFLGKPKDSSAPVTVGDVHIDLAQSECCEDPEDCPKYFGSVNVTEDGDACQSWQADLPHQRDESVVGLVQDPMERLSRSLNGNQCRSVGAKKPWCYTLGSKVRANCNIPKCPEKKISVEEFLGEEPTL